MKIRNHCIETDMCWIMFIAKAVVCNIEKSSHVCWMRCMRCVHQCPLWFMRVCTSLDAWNILKPYKQWDKPPINWCKASSTGSESQAPPSISSPATWPMQISLFVEDILRRAPACSPPWCCPCWQAFRTGIELKYKSPFFEAADKEWNIMKWSLLFCDRRTSQRTTLKSNSTMQPSRSHQIWRENPSPFPGTFPWRHMCLRKLNPGPPEVCFAADTWILDLWSNCIQGWVLTIRCRH